MPDRVRSWVDRALGSPVTGMSEQTGGMSPGCATRVVTASGARAFVKAVGPELNPRTPDLFR
ncbi:MAG TPA: aminoglycoside phosphotransferase family protein, partial [Nocardioidaceae bacterium]|nr:aminoglycoside phosphotransferase family protein [Nocardioidaceae bacterium]